MPQDKSPCLAYKPDTAVEIPGRFANDKPGYECQRCGMIFSSTYITITSKTGCQFDSN